MGEPHVADAVTLEPRHVVTRRRDADHLVAGVTEGSQLAAEQDLQASVDGGEMHEPQPPIAARRVLALRSHNPAFPVGHLVRVPAPGATATRQQPPRLARGGIGRADEPDGPSLGTVGMNAAADVQDRPGGAVSPVLPPVRSGRHCCLNSRRSLLDPSPSSTKWSCRSNTQLLPSSDRYISSIRQRTQ